jgi:hypothetical protein
MFVIAELHYGTRGRKERKRERQSISNITILSVRVEDIRICIES